MLQEPQTFLDIPGSAAAFEDKLNQLCAQYALQAVTGGSAELTWMVVRTEVAQDPFRTAT